MSTKENVIAVLQAIGTFALVIGSVAGFMVLNTLHWVGAL